jgi:hypothetical protein
LRLPDVGGRDQQAGIVGGLQEEAQHERRAVVGGQLETKARAEAVPGAEGGLAPARQLVDDGALREPVGLEAALIAAERRAPARRPGIGVRRARRPRSWGAAWARRAAERWSAGGGPHQRVDDGVEVRAHERVWCPHRARTIAGGGDRVGRRGHTGGDRRDLRGVLAPGEGCGPARLDASATSRDRRHHALASDQLHRELAGQDPRRHRRRQALDVGGRHDRERGHGLEQRELDAGRIADSVGGDEGRRPGLAGLAERRYGARRRFGAPEEQRLDVG